MRTSLYGMELVGLCVLCAPVSNNY